MSILITGGAGYIGSHTVRYLQEAGEKVIVVDNLQSGHREAIQTDAFYPVDLRDEMGLAAVFQENEIEGVIHFAANSLVGVSMKEPYEYYYNNVYGTLCLLKAMRDHAVSHIVFSSTAATYGEPERVPILEDDKTEPTNPYGETKLAMEKMMRWFKEAYGISYTALRYFNAAGAHESGEIGEHHHPETHLIPLILQVPLGQRPHISVFGDDYPTPDHTAVRDYIHVMDLAEAHYLALKNMQKTKESHVFNLGNGSGFSVLEVIRAAREVTGHSIPAVMEERRAGDPAQLIASADKARSVLGWEPKRPDIQTILTDAWRWHSKHPRGYR